METTIRDMKVMFVEFPDGPACACEVFDQVESRLASLKGRIFYATFQYSTRLYRACVSVEHADEVPDVFGKTSRNLKDGLIQSVPALRLIRAIRKRSFNHEH